MNFKTIIIIFSINVIFSDAYKLEVFEKIFNEKSKAKIKEHLSKIDDGHRCPLLIPKESVKNQYLLLFDSTREMNKVLKLISNSRMECDKTFKILWKYSTIAAINVEMSRFTCYIFRHIKEISLIEGNALTKIFQFSTCKSQRKAEWCLSRITDSDVDSNNLYKYPANSGCGVTIYIIDSGVDIKHPDIIGRARHCANFVSGESDEDLNGHGTACASLASGKIAGVAKKAHICSVKVLNKDGSGANSDVIKGIEWVTQQNIKGIVSMSLGASKSIAVNMAVNALVKSGQFTVVSAGNDETNARTKSPASAENAYTVAASNYTNTLASFSNYGSIVDMIAPGTACKLADTTTGGFAYASGTSMAAPLVAGVAAIRLGINNDLTPNKMAILLNKLSDKGVIQGDLKGTPNRFIHSCCDKN